MILKMQSVGFNDEKCDLEELVLEALYEWVLCGIVGGGHKSLEDYIFDWLELYA